MRRDRESERVLHQHKHDGMRDGEWAFSVVFLSIVVISQHADIQKSPLTAAHRMRIERENATANAKEIDIQAPHYIRPVERRRWSGCDAMRTRTIVDTTTKQNSRNKSMYVHALYDKQEPYRIQILSLCIYLDTMSSFALCRKCETM